MLRADEARRAGNLDEALRLAQQAEQIGATAGTRMFLAGLQGQRGDWVASLRNAEQCLREVDLDAQTTAANRLALRNACEAQRLAAEGHVARITVGVPSGAPSAMVVSVNGQTLRPALYGVEQVMAAGTVLLRATLGSRPAWERRVDVSEGMRATLDVSVPEVAPPPRVEPTVAETPTVGPVAQPPRDTPRPGSTQRALGWVATVSGAALVVGGAIAGAAFLATKDGYEADGCSTAERPTQSCDDRYYETLPMLNTLQLAGYIGGGVLVATGVILLATAPAAARTAPTVSFGVGPGGGATVSVEGRF